MSSAAASDQISPDELKGAIDKASVPGEMGSAGNLTYDIPIDMPAFRGLEPSISLNYNSSRKTKTGGLYQGWLGYGWGLDGFDVIERASPGYGLPSFDTSDIYLLNGVELVLCADAAAGSPSCAAGVGGTHTTEVESYRRVAVSGAAGPSRVWKVTDRDGTVSTFKTVAALSGVTPPSGSSAYLLAINRWLLATVTDTYNNTVTYSYACPDMSASPLTAVCYPSTISYTGAVITFHRGPRPDVILMANGYDISATKQRINAISIRSGGALRSAYSLTYDQAPFSGASRLTLVELHGLHGYDEAAVSSLGVVTSEAKKRIASFDYKDTGASYVQKTLTFTRPPNTTYPLWARPNQVGDLNFDGRDELFGSTSTQVTVTTPGGSSGGGTATDTTRWHSIARFDADGSVIDTKHTELETTRQSDSAFPTAKITFTADGRFNPGKNTKDFLDGYITRTDYETHSERWSVYSGANRLITTDSTLTPSLGSCGSALAPLQAACAEMPTGGSTRYNGTVDIARRNAADFDGDGIDTLYPISPFHSAAGVGDFLGNGRQRLLFRDGTKGAFVSGAWEYSGPEINLDCHYTTPETGPIGHNRCVLADVNGDGATDVVAGRKVTSPAAGGADFAPIIYLSTGDSFKQIAVPTTIGGRLVLRDYDNDGKADFLTVDGWDSGHWSQFGTLRVYSLKLGSAANGFALFTAFGAQAMMTIGDFNGDGLPDFFSNLNSLYLSNPGVANPNLVTKIVNEHGGEFWPEYTPSSHWQNDHMPQVMHPVTKLWVGDGRGSPWAITDYAYLGGAYDSKARKFLGYEKIIETKPLAEGEKERPTVETTYRQDLASYGLPELTVYNDGSGAAKKQVDEIWSVNKSAKPYWAKNRQTDTIFSAGQTLKLRVIRTFDIWGNMTDLNDQGRVDAEGDERFTSWRYSPNTSVFITSLPHSETFWDDDAAAQPAKHVYFYYDGSQEYTNPPSRGSLTGKYHRASYESPHPAPLWRWETFSYDPINGNKTAANDGVGNRTEWDYSATSYSLYPTAERNPRWFAPGGDGHFTRTAYNTTCGQPSEHTDLSGAEYTYEYDAFCRMIDYRNTHTGFYRRVYYLNEGDPERQYLTIYEPGLGSRYDVRFYDGLGRVWAEQHRGDTVDGPVRYTETWYDRRNNVAWKSQPYFYNVETPRYTRIQYDWDDRPVETTLPDGNTRTSAYYIRGDVLTYTENVPFSYVYEVDELRRKTLRFISSWGDVIRTTRITPEGGTADIEYRTYDALHRLTKLQDWGLATWTYSYDMLGNRLSAKDPDLGNWDYKYDAVGRLIEQKDARGWVTATSYDKLSRLKKRWIVSPPSGQPMPADPVLVENVYDQPRLNYFNRGQLTTSKNASAWHEMDYGAWGGVWRLRSWLENNTVSHETNYAIGAAHKPVWITYGPTVPVSTPVSVGSTSERWTYNGEGLLSSIPDYVASIDYEADNQTRKITYANGVVTQFTYSLTRRWLVGVKTSKGATVLLDNQYERDPAGRITKITGLTPAESWDYTYNSLDWLLTANNLGNNALDETFTYSANGNLLTRTRLAGAFTYPAMDGLRPHAPTRLGPTPITYDDNGNMVSDGTRVLAWDAANRLSKATIGSAVTNFYYGPDGARAKKDSASSTTFYPSADIEIDAARGVASIGPNDYTRYPHPDIKIVGTQTFFLHRDHLASVRLVTNGSGAAVENTGYAAYGEKLTTAGAPDTTPITRKGYIGERFDPETGLLYLNARYMDLKFGRFISPDDWDPTLPGVGTNRFPRIVLAPGSMELDVDLRGLIHWLDVRENKAAQNNDVSPISIETIRIPLSIKRRGNEARIVIKGRVSPRTDPGLVELIGRAHYYLSLLTDGAGRSLADLAEATGVHIADVSRVLPLASLAPALVAAILTGHHPVELTARQLSPPQSPS